MSVSSIIRSWKVLGVSLGASAALLLGPLSVGSASAGTLPGPVGSLLGGVPVQIPDASSLPVAVPSGLPTSSLPVAVPSGLPTSSLPVAVPSGLSTSSLPVAVPNGLSTSSLPISSLPISSLPISSLPLSVPADGLSTSSLPVAVPGGGVPDPGTVLGQLLASAGLPGIGVLPGFSELPLALPASGLPDPSTIPGLGTIIGATAGNGGGSASGIPAIGSVPGLSAVPGFGSLPGASTLPLVSSLPLSGVSTTATPASNPSGSTFDASAATPFADAGSGPATMPGGSLPFTGEPGWIRLAGAVALGMAGLVGLIALSLRLVARRSL